MLSQKRINAITTRVALSLVYKLKNKHFKHNIGVFLHHIPNTVNKNNDFDLQTMKRKYLAWCPRSTTRLWKKQANTYHFGKEGRQIIHYASTNTKSKSKSKYLLISNSTPQNEPLYPWIRISTHTFERLFEWDKQRNSKWKWWNRWKCGDRDPIEGDWCDRRFHSSRRQSTQTRLRTQREYL